MVVVHASGRRLVLSDRWYLKTDVLHADDLTEWRVKCVALTVASYIYYQAVVVSLLNI